MPYYEIFHNFQFRICVPVSKKKYESPDLSTKIKQTWPQWNKQGQSEENESYDIQTDDIIGQSGDYFIPRPTPSGPQYCKDFLLGLLY